MRSLDIESLTFDDAGLIPAVVQDVTTGQVLMVAWMNRQALTATLETGRATFWSRSRQELWEKGKISGNTMFVEDLGPDCDADTISLLVRPSGPACHTGATSCFGSIEPSTAQIGRLWSTIRSRAEHRPPESYTTKLLESGDLAARKVLEEAGEVAFAAKDLAVGGKRTDLIEESADLVFHLLTLLAQHEVDLAEVAAELKRRS